MVKHGSKRWPHTGPRWFRVGQPHLEAPIVRVQGRGEVGVHDLSEGALPRRLLLREPARLHVPDKGG